MRVWVRAVNDTLCGNCRRRIIEGEPILELSLPEITRRPIRCQKCAGEPVPDLPYRTAQAPIEPTMKMRHISGGLPLDFKKAAGRDE